MLDRDEAVTLCTRLGKGLLCTFPLWWHTEVQFPPQSLCPCCSLLPHLTHVLNTLPRWVYGLCSAIPSGMTSHSPKPGRTGFKALCLTSHGTLNRDCTVSCLHVCLCCPVSPWGRGQRGLTSFSLISYCLVYIRCPQMPVE